MAANERALTRTVINTDHSFPRYTEFWADVEFARFCEISTFPWNFVEFCNGWWEREKYSIFWLGLGGRGKLITTCRHDCAIKYMTASASLFGRQTISVSCGNLPMTNTAYLVSFRGPRKLIAIYGKFAAVSRGIWETGLRNVEKFAA